MNTKKYPYTRREVWEFLLIAVSFWAGAAALGWIVGRALLQ